MNTRGFFMAVLFTAIGFTMTSCPEAAKLALIDVPITMKIAINSSGNVLPSTNTDCDDLSENKDFNDNKSKVKSAKLKEAFIRIDNLSSPAFSNPAMSIENAVIRSARYVLTFDPSYGDTREYVLGTIQDVPVLELIASATNQKGLKITLDEASISPALALITRRPKFCIRSEYGPLTDGSTVTSPSLQGELAITFSFQVDPL